ncbi:MAG: hypothetical protein QM755_15115 [Luteolibacter sp.]
MANTSSTRRATCGRSDDGVRAAARAIWSALAARIRNNPVASARRSSSGKSHIATCAAAIAGGASGQPR